MYYSLLYRLLIMYFIFVVNQLRLHSYNSIYYYYSTYKHHQILLNSPQIFH